MRCGLGFTEATSNAGAAAEAWPPATELDSAKMRTDRARMAYRIFAGRFVGKLQESPQGGLAEDIGVKLFERTSRGFGP
jgi:hypothetical protein